MRALSVFCLSIFALSTLTPTLADESRRFFDFTPVSASNPVVASIDNIQIPLSELRGYRDAERLNTLTDQPAPLTVKRDVLDGLLNEYLYVDEAYRTGVPESPEFMRQMEATRTMILTDFMSMRASGEKITNADEGNDARRALAERLFEAASIAVSNEAYDVLKRAAKAVDVTSAASRKGPVFESKQAVAAKLYAIVDATPDLVLVEYENKTISVRQLLSIYAGLASPRPSIETPEGLTEMIKPLILPELMAIEAMKRGIANEPEFQTKIIQNRNALLRFHVHGQIERKSNAVMRSPTIESELLAWYEAHKSSYAETNDKGEKQIPPYEELRPVIEGDYSVAVRDRLLAEKARLLRKGRSITIDDEVLKNL
jgi:hypothetical protein